MSLKNYYLTFMCLAVFKISSKHLYDNSRDWIRALFQECQSWRLGQFVKYCSNVHKAILFTALVHHWQYVLGVWSRAFSSINYLRWGAMQSWVREADNTWLMFQNVYPPRQYTANEMKTPPFILIVSFHMICFCDSTRVCAKRSIIFYSHLSKLMDWKS